MWRSLSFLTKETVIDFSGLIMQFNEIIRIPHHPLKADQSAVGTINRPLLYGRSILFICIIGHRCVTAILPILLCCLDACFM
ncbi:MAG: hypothetical protein AUI01_05865 [Ktedonobacter sp. 13_2_20CM_2_56_8]|nr:MAG: hypothetical protein AUI01_05865 [Ktedonobacter sp. 13_2_20CM_2_56_8]